MAALHATLTAVLMFVTAVAFTMLVVGILVAAIDFFGERHGQ